MMTTKSMTEYRGNYNNAELDPEKFWGDIGRSFTWKKPFTEVMSGGFIQADYRWYDGGELNITENCLDRHLESQPHKTALIFQPNDPSEKSRSYTYQELYQEVCKAAYGLQSLGVQKGDRVCFYMSQVPELMIGILACARLGAIHSVVFAGFSAQALAGRINDCDAAWLITNNEGLRGAKTINLKNICDEAASQCQDLKNIIVLKRTQSPTQMQPKRDKWWHDIMPTQFKHFEARPMQSEDPLFILYTSGSTGKPKGLLHTTAGYMVYAGYSFANVFQVGDEDIYWCSADIGWITGHTYLTYGPLLNGATTLMFEGVPTWPDAGRFWEIIDKYQVTHFYTAPTAIRALECCDIKFVKKHKLDSLKVLGTVGEPINDEAWQWYHKHIGKERCPIVDTWWQTETGGIMISALAGVTPDKACYATLPLPGIRPVLMDDHGNEIVTLEAQGNLCLKTPWPSLARTIYGDHERMKQTYFSTYKGYYFTGDGARRDSEGNYRITGRVDDVINVSGHRIGTAEVEDALNQHEAIVESAVVGYPHDIKGQGIYAYVICSKEWNKDQLKTEVDSIVTKHIGPIARPDKVQIVTGLPKTRSGKIMRRILRKIAAGELDSIGDVSTLLNPEIVDEIKSSVV